MNANVEKIIAAAEATTKTGTPNPLFRKVLRYLPGEIEMYPIFCQDGRSSDLDIVSAGQRKRYEGDFEYVCFIVEAPKGSYENLDAYQSAFLSRLADTGLAIVGVQSKQSKWLVGGDEVFADQLTIRVRGGFQAAQS